MREDPGNIICHNIIEFKEYFMSGLAEYLNGTEKICEEILIDELPDGLVVRTEYLDFVCRFKFDAEDIKDILRELYNSFFERSGLPYWFNSVLMVGDIAMVNYSASSFMH